jgi:hypothetical protein
MTNLHEKSNLVAQNPTPFLSCALFSSSLFENFPQSQQNWGYCLSGGS